MSKRPLCVLLTSVGIGFVMFSAASVSTDGAKVLELSELPPFSLTNFGYTQSELDAAAPNGLIDLPASIAAAQATVVFEEYEFPAADQFYTTYKLEGLAIINANQVAIINDNDFGIDPANAHVPTRLWKLRLAAQLPLAQ